MKLILRHPVWSALVFEAFLVLLFMLFEAVAAVDDAGVEEGTRSWLRS